MTATITGIGTSNPGCRMSQTQALALFQDLACITEKQRRVARVLFEKSNVNNRFTVVPSSDAYEWCSTSASVSQPVGPCQPYSESAVCRDESLAVEVVPGASAGLSTGQRMAIYSRFAAPLAQGSAAAALNDAGVRPGEITHLVTVSCTGFYSPGVDVHLIRELRLPETTQRLHVGFMGCHGAINAIRAARAIVESDASAVVLLTCVEICSIHCRFQWDSEKIIGNALFGDGSASLVIQGNQTCGPLKSSASSKSSGITIIDTGSTLIDHSQHCLTWEIGDHGFEMVLTSDIGDQIKTALRSWIADWVQNRGLQMDQIDFWGVHPGGPKIVNAVRESLSLDDASLGFTNEILANYGNMSSPTVLFILDRFCEALKANRRSIALPTAKSTTAKSTAVKSTTVKSTTVKSPARESSADQWTEPKFGLLIAFGPGLVAEIALIQFNAI